MERRKSGKYDKQFILILFGKANLLRKSTQTISVFVSKVEINDELNNYGKLIKAGGRSLGELLGLRRRKKPEIIDIANYIQTMGRL